MPTTRTASRSRSRQSHSLAAEAERRVIRPATKAVKSAANDISDRVSDMPRWIPWAAVTVGACALIYGLFQIEAFRDFMRPVTEPINDLLSGESEDGEYEYEETSEGSDYGMNGNSSSSF
jgi:hypothetical protein